jgi:hypothetical protein
VDQQWRSTLLEPVEQRAQASDRIDARERAGGERDAHAADLQRHVDVLGIGALERDGAPCSERCTERQRSLVVGVDKGARLLAREPLDPQGTRQAQERPVEPVELDERGAALGSLLAEIDHVRPLPGQVEHRQAMLAPQEWKLAAVAERLHERPAPEMLVNVDLHHGYLIFSLVDLFYGH